MRSQKIFLGILAASLSSAHAVELTIWNEDVGPVKNGTFITAQQWAQHNLPQKVPGSGLFWHEGAAEEYYHLGEIMAQVEVTFPDAQAPLRVPAPAVVESWNTTQDHATRADFALPLPGESLTIELGDLPRAARVSVKLWAEPYGYTTSGGSNYVKKAFGQTDLSTEQVVPWSQERLLPMVCRYPATRPSLRGLRWLSLMPDDADYEPPYGPDDLSPQWKDVGPSARPIYLTQGFNIDPYRSETPQDLWGIGEERFALLAGHPLSYRGVL